MDFAGIRVRNVRMTEEIVSFVRDPGRAYPFFVEMMGTSHCDGSYRIGRTRSPLFVLEYVRKGRGVVREDGRTFHPAAGDVYLLHQGRDHEYRSDADNPWEKVWMNVSGPLAGSLVRDYGLGDVVHVPGLDLSDLFRDLLFVGRAAQGDADAAMPEAALLFHRMVARLAARLAEASLVPAGRGRPGGLAEAARMKAWLDRHIADRADMKDLSEWVYRSPSQVIRTFRKVYGTTPKAYLLDRRIETAKSLLRNTNLPVREIAERLRFADEHYFSNFFRKRTGLPPSRYRETGRRPTDGAQPTGGAKTPGGAQPSGGTDPAGREAAT